jgi:PAS domain S-box-containing protein
VALRDLARPYNQWTINAQLHALIGAVVVPLILVLGYAIYDKAAASARAAEEEALRLAQITAADSGRLLDETRALLADLAQDPLVGAVRKSPQCDALLAQEHRHQPRYTTLMVVEADGDLVCSGIPPLPSFTGRLSHPMPRQADSAQRFFVGKPIQGRISGKWVVPVFYAMTGENRVEGYVVAAIDLKRLYPVAGLSTLPAGAVVVIVNAEGVIVTRSVDPAGWIGRRLDAPELQALIARGGTGRASGPDGVERLYGVMPMAGVGWTAAVGLPTAPLMGAIRNTLIVNSLVALAILGTALLLAVLVARRIVAPIRDIAAAAKAVAEGESGRRAPVVGAAEVATVGAMFNVMLEAIGTQQQALRESEERLALVVDSSADGIWDWDLRSNRTYFSPRFRMALGYDDEQEFRTQFYFRSALHPEDRSKKIAAQDAALTQGAQFDEEYRLRRRDGNYCWFHGRGRALKDAAGKPYRFAGSITDITAQKAAEAALRESEWRYRVLFELSPEAVIVHQNRCIVLANQAAATLLRTASPADLVGRDIHEVIVEAERGRAEQRRALLETRAGPSRVAETTFHWHALDGTEIVVEVAGARILVNDAPAVLTVARDVTEQVLSREALRLSEERFSLVLQGADLGLWDWDVVSGEVASNARLAEMLGYQAGEIGRHAMAWRQLVHPDDLTQLDEATQAHLNGRTAFYEGEHRLRAKSGEWTWVLVRGKVIARDAAGAPLRAVGANMDITERKRVMEALKTSETRWQFALEGHGDGLWEWSAQEGKVYFSRQWKAMLGYREDELENSMAAWEALVHPDDRGRITDAMRQHLQGTMPRYYAEYRLLAKDGGYRWTAANGRIMEWGPTGLPARVIGTQRDITERKHQEERERVRQEQLIHSGRLIVIGEMASALAHELNQPLTAIASYAGVCARRMDAPDPAYPQIREILAQIGAQAQRAGDIVWHIRDFVRKRETERLSIDIGAMVREMAAFADIEARAQEVAIAVEIGEALRPALADKLQVEQVLLNLIKNGIEAMHETPGERILRIAARMTGADEIEVSVCDHGHGLPHRVAMDIFTPFFTTKPQGMGLGLAISRSIVEAHGGRLWAMPNADAGTTFSFTLPAAPA